MQNFFEKVRFPLIEFVSQANHHTHISFNVMSTVILLFQLEVAVWYIHYSLSYILSLISLQRPAICLGCELISISLI